MSNTHQITRKSVQTAIDELFTKKVHCKKKKQQHKKKKIILLLSYLVTKPEIESLLTIYKHITKSQDRMDRFKFRDVLQNSFSMTDDFMMDKGNHPPFLKTYE
jgi:hypothetical protein